MGDQFVRVLGDCLWITDPYRQTFHQRSCPIPENFDIFQGYNLPQSHKHVLKPLNADELTSIAQQLFNILEQTWILKDEWAKIRKSVQTLAENLHKYAVYLKEKCVCVSSQQKLLHPVRGAEDSIGIIQLNVSGYFKEIGPVIAALREKDNYQFVNVNELPTDSRAVTFHSELHTMSLKAIKTAFCTNSQKAALLIC
ncbi:uncharacterized protein [Ptychodera flava]|uniref:uncharacterized protein n=1 Tax=Ptychodera flava TaxID=63121 RepID=UPI003969D08A